MKPIFSTTLAASTIIVSALAFSMPATAERGICYENTHVTFVGANPPYGNLYWRDSFIIRTPNHVCDNDRPPHNYFVYEDDLLADVVWDAERLCQYARAWFGERCSAVQYTITGDFNASGVIRCASSADAMSVE